MVNTKELNNSISELEEQVKNFKCISDAYAEIAQLKNQLDELKNIYHESINEFNKTNNVFNEKLINFDNYIQESTKANRNNQKELEYLIIAKIEKLKSDLQVEIRNEGAQIQRGLENSLTLNLNNFQNKVNETIEKQNRKVIVLIIMVSVSLVLLLSLGIKVFFF